MFFTFQNKGPEISDAVVSFDSDTLERVPVLKSDVIREFAAAGNERAGRIVGSIPERNGVLDASAVDELLVRAHCEMQRISEEFQHGQRVAELLKPIVASVRENGVAGPVRIADIGWWPRTRLRARPSPRQR